MSGQRRSELERALLTQFRLLETTLRPGTVSGYRSVIRHFLQFLRRRFPEVTRPGQLTRDPHLLGWLEELWTYRTRQGQPLHNTTRGGRVLQLRTLLDMLQDGPRPPAPDLLRRSDVPQRQFPLPRPLHADDDRRLCQYWDTASGLHDSALYLMRLTGMRIGECVDLAPDCLRHFGDGRWSIHVPHGKPRSERFVPLDDQARSLVERLTFLRSLPAHAADPGFLLPKPRGRADLMATLRARLRTAAAQAGVQPHLVPHQLRHTYATTMLRAGVSLPALMRLLGHHNANMTLIYVEVTQQDLHREYEAAQQRPRHLVPRPPTLAISPDEAPTLSVDDALHAAIRLLNLLHDGLGPNDRKSVVLLIRRLTRARSLAEKLRLG